MSDLPVGPRLELIEATEVGISLLKKGLLCNYNSLPYSAFEFVREGPNQTEGTSLTDQTSLLWSECRASIPTLHSFIHLHKMIISDDGFYMRLLTIHVAVPLLRSSISIRMLRANFLCRGNTEWMNELVERNAPAASNSRWRSSSVQLRPPRYIIHIQWLKRQ